VVLRTRAALPVPDSPTTSMGASLSSASLNPQQALLKLAKR